MILIDAFFFSSRRRHTIFDCDWSSDVCSSDLAVPQGLQRHRAQGAQQSARSRRLRRDDALADESRHARQDRKSTRLNSSHSQISYAVFCLKKKKKKKKKRNRKKQKRKNYRSCD